MTSAEVENLKAQIGELYQRIAAVELARDTSDDAGSSGAVDPGGANEAQVIEAQKLHAFDITCDGREADPWLVYLPDGCVRFGDFTPDRIDPEPDANTHLADLGTDIKDGGIYAHLYLELADDESGSDSTSEPEVTGFPLLSIDTTPTQQPTEENIKVIDIKIATITDGAVSQNVSSALILSQERVNESGVTSLKGDDASSEKIDGDVEIKGGKSGLTVKTDLEGQLGSDLRKPVLSIDVKGRDAAQGCDNKNNWGCKTFTYPGGGAVAHFLGCHDIDLSDLDPGGGASNVIGSDYVDVSDKTEQGETKRKVSAKINTSQGEHALVTSDTNQKIRSVKQFTGQYGHETAIVEIDSTGNSASIVAGLVSNEGGEVDITANAQSGVVTCFAADGERQINLDPTAIPSDCQKKSLEVHKLKVKYPRPRSGKSDDTFHIISCDDIDIDVGDAIQTVAAGSPSTSGDYTVTPVTITLKDGTVLPAFNINAKNGRNGTDGANGHDGEDGVSVVDASAGTPIMGEETTSTPISFTLSDGTVIGPVTVVASNGSAEWHNLQFNGETVTQFQAKNDVNIIQKELIEGDGITLTPTTNGIKIDCDYITDGYTGNRTYITALRYNSSNYCLEAKYVTDSYEDGVLVEEGTETTWAKIEGFPAVQETV